MSKRISVSETRCPALLAARVGALRLGRQAALGCVALATLPGLLPGKTLAQAPKTVRLATVSLERESVAGDGRLPDAPAAQQQSGAAADVSTPQGVMSGTVVDSNGAVVQGASVALQAMGPPGAAEKKVAVSDGSGYFRFSAVDPGQYRLTVTAAGFAPWSETEIPMHSGVDLDLPEIALKVASAVTDVEVVFSQRELAAEQVRIEEKQRVLGVFPNFYTSYVWHAEPLTPRQKFQLAWRSSIDWESFAASAGIAAVQQAQDDFEGYGQGVEGFAKRFGASDLDGWVGTMIGAAVLPTLLHQDPRYFYKGTGTIRQRALYAIATTVICKGDNGKWQPNYSNIGGNLAAGAISNLYYPKGERNGVTTTIDNALIGTAAGAAGALIQEFLLKKLTPGTAAHDKP